MEYHAPDRPDYARKTIGISNADFPLNDPAGDFEFFRF